MLAELAVILIILVTVALVYLKGSIIKAFVLLINTFVAATIAFAYFETLGLLIIKYNIIVGWAFATALILIFALTLAILNAIGGKLAPADIYFGDFYDRILRCLIAVFAGFAIAGVILTAAAMMPIGKKWPYERFSSTAGSTEPQKTLILNADGFITNFASWLSRGSMSGQKSLAVFHPDFLNEIYLNRIGCNEDNLAVAGKYAITVEAAWIPQIELVSTDNQPISGASQTKPVLVRASVVNAFSMAQVRLVCKGSDSADNLKGSGRVVWPVGCITRQNIVERKTLSEVVKLKKLDFVFYIPTDTVPVMLLFKQNLVTPITKLASSENIPPPL